MSKQDIAIALRFATAIWRIQARGLERFTRPSLLDWHGCIAHKDWATDAWSDQYIPHKQLSDTRIDFTNKDIYFSPCLFADAARRRAVAMPSRWLYADLDPVDPRTVPVELTPTLAWETSRDNFQALWLLNRHLTTNAFERLNQRLTYELGADLGGWSTTKVLRLPGTLNTKHGTPQPVRLLRLPRHKRHRVERLLRRLRHTQTATGTAVLGALPPSEALPDRFTVLARHRASMTPLAKRLLNTRQLLPSDDRSARLWTLYTELLSVGLEPAEVLVLAQQTIWNKYRGQRRELAQLWLEIGKAHTSAKVRHQRRDRPQPKRQMLNVAVFRHRRFAEPKWLVEEIWTEGAFGFVGGEPKTYKSTITLDLAISIATGTPFLDTFRVPPAAVGPVLLWQEENDEGLVQDRVNRIEQSRGLGYGMQGYLVDLQGANYPLEIGNRHTIDLNNKDDLKFILREVLKYKPRLVILDPLYRMIPSLDERESAGIAAMINNLARIQQASRTALLIVHHYTKPQAGVKHTRPLTRLSGTGLFGRSYESALWIEAMTEPRHTVRIAASHRAMPDSRCEYVVTLNMPEDMKPPYKPELREWKDGDEKTLRDTTTPNTVADLTLKSVPAKFRHIRQPVRLRDLATNLKIDSKTLRQQLRQAGFTFERGASYGNGHKHIWVMPPDYKQ